MTVKFSPGEFAQAYANARANGARDVRAFIRVVAVASKPPQIGPFGPVRAQGANGA